MRLALQEGENRHAVGRRRKITRSEGAVKGREIEDLNFY